MQCVWPSRKRLDPVKVLFNVAGMMANATALTYLSYHWLLARFAANKPILLMIAALVFFFANTLPISIVIAMTEGKSSRKVWSECYFWSFPYYLVGAAAVGLVGIINRSAGWQTSLLVLPLIYWVYRSYRLYLGRLEAEKERVEVEKRHVERSLRSTCAPSRRWRWPLRRKTTRRTRICSACAPTQWKWPEN